MLTIALICVLLGVLMLAKGYLKRKQEKEQKPFVVLLGTLVLIWMFPGAALLIIGLVLIALLGGGCIPY